MSTAATGIEWTDRTWNPTRGCRRISPGCLHCYAERVAARFCGPGQAYEGLVQLGPNGPRWNGKVRVVEEALREPLSWRKPQRVFVDSMSDLFYEGFSDDEINRVFAVMGNAPRHTFQVLTKRTDRLLQWSENNGPFGTNVRAHAHRMGLNDSLRWPLPNVEIGASVEDQKSYDARILPLLKTRAARRFLSYEPAIEEINFSLFGTLPRDVASRYTILHELLHWIIVGGESGPGARPFDLAWARSALAQGRAAEIPVFIKQLGALPYAKRAECSTRKIALVGAGSLRVTMSIGGVEIENHLGLNDRKGGDWSEWPPDLRVREMPEAVSRG